MFNKGGAHDVASVLLPVERERFAAKIVGLHPGGGDSASEHVGPPDCVLVVECVVDETGILVGRWRKGVGPYGCGVVEPTLEANCYGLRHVDVYLQFVDGGRP